MEKIDTRTPDLTEENITKLIELFPQVATEVESVDGQIKKAVDFDALRDLLGDVAEGQRERYQFTWPGKHEAKAEARRPIDKTMIPCPEKSVDWDTTENLYIEGDNLDALKLLKETYAGKIKLIYIDPPYNTGHDFIYDDDFTVSNEAYESGEESEEGRLVANLESNGRFHSDWCTMMYPRILLAKELLAVDGAIFVSIDDNESKNLHAILDEIFGSNNFIADVIWKHTQQSKNDERHFSRQYNHTFCYAKNKNALSKFSFERTPEDNVNYSNPDDDPKGPWRSGDVRSPNYRKTLCFDIIAPDGTVISPPANGWRWSEESVKEKIASGEIKFKPDNSGIIRKIYLCDQDGRTPENLWDGPKYGTTRTAAQEIKNLFDGYQVFDTPKPKELIEKMIELMHLEDAYILDFFSGSASSGHAVIDFNRNNQTNNHFILIQIDEKSPENSIAYAKGYSTVALIGEERLRRAGTVIIDEIESENKQLTLSEEAIPVPDIGFRVLRIDSSNFKDTYQTPDQADQASLLDAIDNVKDGRTAADILFQVLPAFRIPYSAHIEEHDIKGKKIFDVNHGQLLACFDADVTNDVIEEIARRKPSYAVMRDLSFKDDSAAANFEELFKTFSPDTIRRVI